SRSGFLSLFSPYPITSCEDPYIGEESIRRPPPSKNARMTSAQASRAAVSLPTLNVIQLPSPTTGRASPLEGIGRVRTGDPWAAADRGRRNDPAPAAASEASRVRRLIVGGRGIGILSPLAEHHASSPSFRRASGHSPPPANGRSPVLEIGGFVKVPFLQAINRNREKRYRACRLCGSSFDVTVEAGFGRSPETGRRQDNEIHGDRQSHQGLRGGRFPGREAHDRDDEFQRTDGE